MSHTIESPVKRFPGSVALPDYLNYLQYRAWRDGVTAASAVINVNKPEGAGPETVWEYDVVEYRHAFMSGVCGVVEKWELTGLPAAMTPDLFPPKPERAATALFNWLVGEITKLVTDDVDGDDPKSLPPSSAG